MENDFRKYVELYFSSYLISNLNLSSNTIKTYKYTFLILFDFFKLIKKKKVDEIKIEDFTFDLISEFIIYLRENRHNSDNTINQRIACIKSFFNFVQLKDIKYIDICSKIKALKHIKCSNKQIGYIEIEEIRNLFSVIDLSKPNGLKYLTMLVLLYETGIRVDELCSLKINDVVLANDSIINIINGKGNKTRTVPISKDLKKLLKQYLKLYKIDNDSYLFLNRQNEKYSRWGIMYIINKYVKIAKEQNDKFYNIKITPHIFRHSKAMHLLDAGVDIETIKEFLGHSSINTTSIYAKANPKHLRKCLEENAENINHKLPYTKKEKLELDEWIKNNL